MPNREKAEIDRAKLTDYILSRTHPVGRWKAKIFHSLGYFEQNVHLLEQEIISIAKSGNVVRSIRSEFGERYIIDGKLKGLHSEDISVRTIPRFLTIYPKRNRGNMK